MIRIAYIIDTIETSEAGTEKQLLLLLNGLDRQKFKPYLICLRNSEWLESNNLPCDYYVLNISKLISFGFVKGLINFRNLNKKIKFDLIQTFFKDGNIFGTIAAKYSRCHNIISSRRNIGYWHTKLNVTLLKIFSKWTSNYLCNSTAAKKMTIKIEKVDSNKIGVIYNGLDLDKFDLINNEIRIKQRKAWAVINDEILIGAVANLRSVKNINLMIETASLLLKQFPKVKFVVVGEGDQRECLQNKIDNLGISDVFLLPGAIKNIIEPLAAFDIAVMPSLSESFSNSLIEYMLAKLPIVSSDVGGNSEAIKHNETGLLFSLEDKDGLLDGLKKILSDEALSKRLGENAYDDAIKNYSISTMILNHENYYENIANK